MTITKKEAEKIKEHLLSQLKNFPENKRPQIKSQIKSMTTKEVETFVEQNKLTHLGNQCIFCSIIANRTPSYKISENKDNIAILELNPLSKGHTLIVPKKHSEKINQSTNALAEEISKKLQKKFKPQRIEINEIKIMGHALIEVVPIYGNEKERKPTSEKELEEIKKEILKAKEIKIKEKSEPIEIPKLKPRIP